MSLLLAILASLLVPSCNSGAVQLDNNNIDGMFFSPNSPHPSHAHTFSGILENNDLVLINFYADWCRFSNMLAPIWDEGADKVAAQLPGVKVVLGKVDCDKEGSLGQRFHITKYPTIKYVQHGVVAKKEYRGQRSAEAFLDFVRQQVKDPIEELNSENQVQNMDQKKRHLIGYFDSKGSPDYENFLKVSRALKEDCTFHVGLDPIFQNLRGGQNKAVFKDAKANDLVRMLGGIDCLLIIDPCFRPSQESFPITTSFTPGHRSTVIHWSEKSRLKMPRSSPRRGFPSSFSSASQRTRPV